MMATTRIISHEQMTMDPILKFFAYDHLPAALQAVSAPFYNLAAHVVGSVPRNAERSVALRKLLEAKDAAVRANVGEAGVASGGTWLDRVKTEHAELSARMKKLAAYFADGYPGMEKTENIAQLNEQYLAMENYRAILAARIENAEHAARTGPGTGLQPNIHGLGPDSPAGDNPHYRPDVERHPPMEGLEDGSAVREIGGHDQDRDGPVKFEG